ncbi:hypothetical protein, partial [Salmonella sp. s58408]|uniref:hypothetical protein n=1 Tax=Salmonella sp. s58408 TaxID=3159701 RepID=UPI0039801933
RPFFSFFFLVFLQLCRQNSGITMRRYAMGGAVRCKATQRLGGTEEGRARIGPETWERWQQKTKTNCHKQEIKKKHERACAPRLQVTVRTAVQHVPVRVGPKLKPKPKRHGALGGTKGG